MISVSIYVSFIVSVHFFFALKKFGQKVENKFLFIKECEKFVVVAELLSINFPADTRDFFMDLTKF